MPVFEVEIEQFGVEVAQRFDEGGGVTGDLPRRSGKRDAMRAIRRQRPPVCYRVANCTVRGDNERETQRPAAGSPSFES